MMEITKDKKLWLKPGSPAELEEVLRGSQEVWGRGISFQDYLEYHCLIREHPWSKENYQHLVLVDDSSHIFSSCKIYQHQLRIDSEILRLGALGAVFTPKANRRMGYASQMLSYLIDLLKEQEFDLVMLFSDIGTEFYARLGFQLIPKQDPVYGLGENRYKPAEIQILDYMPEELLKWDLAYDRRERFALLKPLPYFQLLSERISWHQKYLGFKTQKVIVSFSEKTYLLADLNRAQLLIRRFGTASDNPELALANLLGGLFLKFSFYEISGWLPKEFDRFRCLKLKRKEPRMRTQMMVLALSQKARMVYELSPEEIQFWLADYF